MVACCALLAFNLQGFFLIGTDFREKKRVKLLLSVGTATYRKHELQHMSLGSCYCTKGEDYASAALFW